ncbi:MAG TPA: lipopolysaccharide kinase InaA family protein [Candidatus Brocadiia bacterium]|nr:lipopolysaccharide kinase InaA family protein [Candidatus Brocadiales bacterium]
MPENLLASFSTIKQGETTFYVKNNYKDILLNLDIDSLRKEALEKGSIRSGREPHAVIHIPELADERIIIKHSRHGGLFGYIAGDMYCKRNRFMNELIATETAIERGVNTAEVIAVIKHKIFGTFYRYDVLSKEIPDSLDLVEFLTNPLQRFVGAYCNTPLHPERKKIIETIAQTIRKMHDAGLYHTDLHLKNILIQSTSGDTPPSPLRGTQAVLGSGERGVCKFKAYIIDMDKAKTMDLMSTKLRMRNLSRLDRSVEKLKEIHPRPFLPPRGGGLGRGGHESLMPSKTDKLRFFIAYINSSPQADEMKQYIKMRPRSHWFHRLLWRLPF